MLSISDRLKMKKLKKMRKEKKWSDPYKIDSISDEDFNLNINKFKKMSVLRIVVGIMLLIVVLIIFWVLWDFIFYSSGMCI